MQYETEIRANMMHEYTRYHRQQVEHLASQGYSTHGFAKALRGTFKGLEIENPELIPDAYKIALDEREVHCYEVEVTSPLTRLKLSRYARLWFVLDCIDVKLRTFSVDPLGHPYEFDLLYNYYDMLMSRKGAA